MATDVTPERVIDVLYHVGIQCVLMGTHALGTYRSEPRATQDVDVLVRKKEVRKAIRALAKEYPGLTVRDYPVVTRFIEPTTNKVVLDVMKPTQNVYKLVFRHTVSVGKTHSIPDLEMALAAKFAAMVSPNREPAKKMTDAGDFIDVIRTNRRTLDVKKLKRLADIIYPDGGTEILEMIENIDAGRTISV